VTTDPPAPHPSAPDFADALAKTDDALAAIDAHLLGLADALGRTDAALDRDPDWRAVMGWRFKLAEIRAAVLNASYAVQGARLGVVKAGLGPDAPRSDP
jgi:hypothetical protein